MGVYLSSPVTEKESVNEDCPKQGYCYGASSMQGWRITQEDAHNCIPVFDEKSKTSFFAVYDGHGGSEVAKYCERHFPDFVKCLMESSSVSLDTDPTQFIQSAFLAFDATLTADDVIKELKLLSGKEDDNEEDEEDGPVGRSETELLKEEAHMPLHEVLAQYNSGSGRDSPDTSASDNGPVADAERPSSSKSPSSAEPKLSSSACEKDEDGKQPHKSAPGDDSSSTVSSAADSSTNNNCASSAGGSSAATGSAAGSGSSGSATKERSSKVKAASDMCKIGAANDSDDEEDDDMWEDDSDDDDEEEDEDAWEDKSDDEDDEDEEADSDSDKDVPLMDTSDEEPGSDSGCTACVLLMQGQKLIVANAGDSRCVLARDGCAVELSFDHKPEDEPERTRIERAGGKVTADGRVNGGLNLSRAIGDHVYKRNTDLPAREQMITALPDVHMEELTDADQFIVIACDGIWNSMSSQEVVDYVLGKLKDPDKRKQPAIICEELFDRCLAPNTFGDGTGCDNMTCIIIVLNTMGHIGSNNNDGEQEASAGIYRLSGGLVGKQTGGLGIEQKSGSKDEKPSSVSDESGNEDSTEAAEDVVISKEDAPPVSGDVAGQDSVEEAGVVKEEKVHVRDGSGEVAAAEDVTKDEKSSLKRCSEDVDGTDKKRMKLEENVV